VPETVAGVRPRTRFGRIAREIIAPLAWCYAVLHLVVLDVERTLLQTFAPNALWLLPYKFFLFLGAAMVLLIVLGWWGSLRLGGFVLAYPIVLLFWRIPKRFYRKWAVLVVFLPVIVPAVARLRSTFLLYSLAAFGAVFILATNNRALIVVAVGCLTPLLAAHLVRSFRKASAESLLTRLTRHVQRLRSSIEAGTFVPWDENAVAGQSAQSAPAQATESPKQIAYASHGFAELIAERIKTSAGRRHYDLYLVASWFFTVVLTAGVFALVHFGIHKAIPGAYANAVTAGLGSFFGLSLGILTTSNLSIISPVSAVAMVASYLEVLCSAIILVIIVFSVLTVAREAFRENLDALSSAVSGVAAAIESRIRIRFKMTLSELEVALMSEIPTDVNSLRKLRGLPELPTPNAGSVVDQQHRPLRKARPRRGQKRR
jgi:hypothetical protein